MTGVVPELWLMCGSQHLYGPGPLQEVAANARHVAEEIDAAEAVTVRVRFKTVLTTPDDIRAACLDANADPLPRRHRMDAHLLSREDVDRWSRCAAQAGLHLHTQANASSPGPTSTWTS
jgi:L-arabinose isomerase